MATLSEVLICAAFAFLMGLLAGMGGGKRSMTKQEKIIVSAYTGYLMCNFSDVHKYIEEKLEHPVFTFELERESTWDLIKEAAREDFKKLCQEEEE